MASPAISFGQAKKKASVPPPPQPAATPATVDPKELVRRASENEFQNERVQKYYTYVQREETRKLDSDGKVKSTESETSDVMVLYGEGVNRLIARDDKPLSAEDSAKVEAKIDKFMRERKNETPEEKQKRLADQEKDREKERTYVGEISEAYNFHLDGIENVNGRDTYVISAEPRPDYHAQSRAARALLPAFHFKVWIDKADCQWVKLDAEALDNASYGLFLLRLHKGTRAHLEQVRVNDEVWLPAKVYVKLDARVVLFKSYLEEIDINYKDYKKFRTEIAMGPAVPAN
ncbi:MAG: hypothetical protein WAK91_18045 [Candidatus Acidiferrales bacterium]